MALRQLDHQFVLVPGPGCAADTIAALACVTPRKRHGRSTYLWVPESGLQPLTWAKVVACGVGNDRRLCRASAVARAATSVAAHPDALANEVEITVSGRRAAAGRMGRRPVLDQPRACSDESASSSQRARPDCGPLARSRRGAPPLSSPADVLHVDLSCIAPRKAVPSGASCNW
jgi:hypothetical protein